MPEASLVYWMVLSSHTGTIRPVAAIIFTGVMSAVFCAIPFNLLVQMFLTVRIVNLFCEYSALIRLRYTEPDTPRPFLVPGGMIGAYVIGIPTFVLSIFTLIYTDKIAWIFGASTNLVIVISFGIRHLILRYMAGKRAQHAMVN